METNKEFKQNILVGITLALMASFCFALASGCIKALLNFPTIESVFFQQFVSLIVILPYALKNRELVFNTNHLWLHSIRALAGIFSFIAYYFAIQKINLVDATLLSYTTPFFTPFVWRFWAKEKIEKEVFWSILLGFAGVAIILNPSANVIQIPALIGISSAILSALALSSIRMLHLRNETVMRTLFNYFLIGSLVTFFIALFSWQKPLGMEWVYLIGLGTTSALGQVFLTKAYKHSSPSFLSPISYSIIIFTAVIACLFFEGSLTKTTILGGCLIITGGIITSVLRHRILQKQANKTLPSDKDHDKGL